jgi:hypothetical protein
MPKSSKNKYYAVKLGREGPKIYNTWDEVSAYNSDVRSNANAPVAFCEV